jgi:site-specific recombinase XerD
VISEVSEWRVFFTKRGLQQPRQAPELDVDLGALIGWLDDRDVLDGTPFLIGPDGGYDIELNRFFLTEMLAEPYNTQAAIAYDLKKFLAFLADNRGGKSWRDATPEDRAAYKQWRTVDPRGPHVESVTWDREVASVNRFYKWASGPRRRYVAANPIVQKEGRSRRPGRSSAASPAEASHRGPRRDVKWLPVASYRQWRDVGLRGFTPAGLPDASFRWRCASRNAAFADLMVRTGLRVSEQTFLTVFELPELVSGIQWPRFWLPESIAKGRSARWVYVPAPTLGDVLDYVELERADAVDRAREAGAYDRVRDPLVVEDPRRPVVELGGRAVKVEALKPVERSRLLVRRAGGLEPAVLWLNEFGMPGRRQGWREVFDQANDRCARLGVPVACHPHMLRHSYAVITLEQLQRGHIQNLGGMNPAQRLTYQNVFGDPLDWVRKRLGHASMTSTQIYMHTLEELEMQTRMALVPDGWDAVPVGADDPVGGAGAAVDGG